MWLRHMSVQKDLVACYNLFVGPLLHLIIIIIINFFAVNLLLCVNAPFAVEIIKACMKACPWIGLGWGGPGQSRAELITARLG